MEIISLPFALSALTAIVLYYFVKPGLRIWLLALLSCTFIAGYNYLLLIYLVFYSLVNFSIGIGISSSKFPKSLYITGIVFNLLQITLLKYASFAVGPILKILGLDLNVSRLGEIIVPLGISYFTLQGIGYLITVKMGWEKPELNYLKFLLYIIFFPRFLSGPVDRSNLFLPQLEKPATFYIPNIISGLRIALGGFFKKVVIANQLGTLITTVYSDIGPYDSGYLWMIFLLQPLYLYFDFSGYTDIAIGFAKMFGINIPPNFNRPFLAENVTTFWKRFHMSLSSWFNDYVFKQTSFKYRKWGKYAAVFAVFVTFTLFGIWHGAGWNFMALGLIQAIAINYEFFTKPLRYKLFSGIPIPVRKAIGRITTYLFFAFSLVFFFSGSIGNAIYFSSRLFRFQNVMATDFTSTLFVIALASASAILIYEWLKEDLPNLCLKLQLFWRRYLVIRMLAYYGMAIMILALIGKNLTFVYQTF